LDFRQKTIAILNYSPMAKKPATTAGNNGWPRLSMPWEPGHVVFANPVANAGQLPDPTVMGAIHIRLIRGIALGFALVILTGDGDDFQSLRALQVADQRALSIGYRLAVSAGDLCPAHAPLSGISVQDLRQYPVSLRGAAAMVFASGNEPQILAVAKDSPAERAGVRPNDRILLINGKPVPPAQATKQGFDGVEQVYGMLDRAAAGHILELRLQRQQGISDVRFELESGCPSRFMARPSPETNADADGTYVQVDSGMMDFVANDDELAAVLAHELAHNILGHRARLEAAGVNFGMFRRFGRNARLTRVTEDEADRLSVYLMDRGGFPTGAALTFRARFRALGRGGRSTHSSEVQRIAIIQREIDRIATMKRANEAPYPEFLAPGASRAGEEN
jgi:hypothetical protein